MRTALYIFLLLLPCTVVAQQPFMRDWWLNESNTPVKVNDMLQDAKGYVWLATDAGVYSFNGRDFTAYEDKVQKPATAVVNMHGGIWVGYSDGSLGFVNGKLVQPSPVKTQITPSAITSLYTPDGYTLWITTQDNGVSVLLNNRVVTLDSKTGLSDNFVYNMQACGDKTILAGTDKGINRIRIENNKVVMDAITTTQGLPDNIVRVVKKMPEANSCWLGMQQGGVAIYHSGTGKVTVPPIRGGWQWGQVNDILVMNQSRVWIATDDGYLLNARLESTDSLHITAIKLDGKRINKLHCGRSGMLWCATNQGLTMVTAEYMNYISLQAPYNISTLTAMACDKDNTLWFAQGAALYSMPLVGGATPQLAAKLDVDIKSLYADEQGRIWIGSLGEGLWLRDVNGSLRNIAGIGQLNNETVLDITGTYDRVWVSGLNGVEELTYPGTYTQQVALVKQHTKRTGIGSDYVYQIYPDKKGRIWMATDGAGVCTYTNGTYRNWDTADGMPAKVAYTVTEDAKGHIWVGTLDNGICRYDGKRWTQIGRAQGLQDINISTIAANATGQVVVVHSKGMDVWYPSSNQFRSYTRRQLGIDSLSDVLKLYANDKQGNVYIPFQAGFVVFKNIDDYFDIRPIVNIRSVSAAFKEVEDGRNDFDYSENYFSFRYEGINFANPERLHYRYKLEGYNDNWTITSDEAATFPQLPDGTYTFRVQASLNNRFSSSGEAIYTFIVKKPYWKTGWFILGSIVLLLGVGYTYLRIRERNLKKITRLQGERMKFEYEHLKSQVNPHFLFNSLNTLTSLIDEDQDAAMTYTSRLSDLYRNMLAYRDRDLVLLSEEWEILENYMFIQQTRFGNALRLEVDVPAAYMITRKIVPLALQLLVENAIKHNVVSRSKPLTITIRATEDTITVSNPLQPKFSKEKVSGLGLVNIRKRYSLLSKKSITFGADNDHYIVTLPLL